MFVSNGPAEIGFYNKNISICISLPETGLLNGQPRLKAKVSLLGIHHPSQQLTKNGSGRLLMKPNLQSEFDRLNELSSALSDGTFIRGLTRQPGNQVSHIELAEDSYEAVDLIIR